MKADSTRVAGVEVGRNGQVLKIPLKVFADEPDVGLRQKRGVKDNSKAFGLNIYKYGGGIY